MHNKVQEAIKGLPLSPRELEILRLIRDGKTNIEISTILTISRATVRTHIEHILAKLEVYDRISAVVEGLRRGVLELND